jgi:hypothetical protein
VRAAAEEARWHFGRFALDPVFELREIAWIDPGEGEDGDLTASFAAGLRGYLPVGSRSTFLLHAIPQYVWWRERDDESRLAGEAGVGLVVDANRLQLDLRGSGSDLNGFVASELERRARVESRTLDADATFLISTKIGLWVHGVRGDHESRSEAAVDEVDDPLANLDRAERTIEGGVRWYPTSSLTLGVGAGTSRTDFDDSARDRSNRDETVGADLAWNRTKLGANLSVRRHEVEAESGSEFGEFSGSTGSARIHWSPRDAVTLSVYGLRDLVYTALDDSAWFLEERVGGELGLRFGGSVGLSLFVEEGERRFEGNGVDDVSSFGGALSVEIRRLALRVGARSTELEGVHGDQTYSELTFGVSYGKLRGAWY